jgi:hypothetical protein
MITRPIINLDPQEDSGIPSQADKTAVCINFAGRAIFNICEMLADVFWGCKDFYERGEEEQGGGKNGKLYEVSRHGV